MDRPKSEGTKLPGVVIIHEAFGLFFIVSHGLMFLIVVTLRVKRLRGQKNPIPEPWKR